VLSDFALFGFHALQALTEEKVRPFDKNRSGLALGEGAAFVVLESENHAAAGGVKPYGKVKGYASRADANHLTGPHPEGRGLADAINQALSNSYLVPQDIDYINAHGTGTLYNDLMETKAIKHVFGKKAYDIPINSTKSLQEGTKLIVSARNPTLLFSRRSLCQRMPASKVTFSG